MRSATQLAAARDELTRRRLFHRGRPSPELEDALRLRPMRAQGPGQAELRQLGATMERPILRAGMLGVSQRDGQGKPQRLPGLTWLDNDQGATC
ncbi:ESX secretion-associated protein EspG [Actinokineospora sp.]|uniref:ESX secretion-associated protein EspG n=1 Tax=Actinokineospora sp. TaxID=1872133 RepID=UPI003D6A2831